MDISTALTSDITELCSSIGLDPDSITVPLDSLHRDLAVAVASYVGLQLTLTDQGRPITFTSLRSTAGIGDVASSLHLPLSAITVAPTVGDPARALIF